MWEALFIENGSIEGKEKGGNRINWIGMYCGVLSAHCARDQSSLLWKNL